MQKIEDRRTQIGGKIDPCRGAGVSSDKGNQPPVEWQFGVIAVDGAIGGLRTLFGVANLTANEYDKGLTVSSFFWVGILGVSVYQGNKRVNDCRAFNARLAQRMHCSATQLER